MVIYKLFFAFNNPSNTYSIYTKTISATMQKIERITSITASKIVTGFNTTGVFMTGKNMTYFSKTVKLSPS